MGRKVVSRLAAIVLGAAAGGGFSPWKLRSAGCPLGWRVREVRPCTRAAPAGSLAAIAHNPMFAALAPDVVARHAAVPGERFRLGHGIEAELFIVPGKVPLYLEGDDPDTASESSANVGVEISSSDARLAFVPGAAAITPAVMQRLERADVIFFDGTLFRDDEMIASGTGTKTGRRMGHMPLDGPDGTLAALAGLRARRIFVHINNTNPTLVDGSPDRGGVIAAGWEIAEDGLEVVL